MGLTTYQNSNFKHGLELSDSCTLNKYLYDIISTLVQNQKLLKLLINLNDNPLQGKDIVVSVDNPIINQYIYPYIKDISTTKEKGCKVFINWVDGVESNGIFQDLTLQIDILVSNDENILICNKGRRDLEIKHEIQKTLTGSHGLGLGALNQLQWNIIVTQTQVGYTLRYKIKDFR